MSRGKLVRGNGDNAGKEVKRKDVLSFSLLFRIKRRLDHPFDSAIIAHLKMQL